MRRRSILAAVPAALAAQQAGVVQRLPLDTTLLTAHIEFISWATRRDLDVIRELTPDQRTRELVSSFPSILATLHHLYRGNVSWFTRMRGGHILWDDIVLPESFGELDVKWQKLFDDMISWARSRTAEQWQSMIIRGKPEQGLEMPLWQAIMHLSNHDSYHRGQLTTLIRQVGGTPVNTDLLFFYRERFPA